MKIDKTRLNKLCNLAKLEINDSEVENYLQLLNKDLESLQDLDTINVGDLEESTNNYDM